ncbi:hypothetical protein [Acanthamoeba polyphaga mimivirus]|uniref:Uncharacterized protein n=4 Tax=Megamimivirinae TaxID=3044648 RepID=A0A2L2DIV6_MIMIV|nr:hypothetical protein MegaChil _gp0345 [Megavirus chiliensis]AEX61455.1 hypothetical protein c7_L391 [Megavirus courdo7]AFX92383.1 hypothetical protein CE11_00355 [Megavirus courdo11]AVG46076.1 hypothetical protein [Acanthamoeba polyphaga mimivirus]AVL93678.1 hypothetical protein mvi_318 [Megavirus vitis]AEQ32772.1 hypothetical protein [Megavirus chiliensis]
MKKKIDYRREPYWSYETSIGDNTCVSIRCYDSVPKEKYYSFLGQFIISNSDRIKYIDKPSVLSCGDMVCMVYLEGSDTIVFENCT